MFSQATGQSIFQNFDLRFPVSVFVSFCFIVILDYLMESDQLSLLILREKKHLFPMANDHTNYEMAKFEIFILW